VAAALFALMVVCSSVVSVLSPSLANAAPVVTQTSCELAGGKWVTSIVNGVSVTSCSGVSVASQQNLDWQVQSMLYYRAIGKCFQQQEATRGGSNTVTLTTWFNVGTANIGPYMRDLLPDVGDDATISCSGDSGKRLVSQALSLWGLKADEVLCGGGFTWKEFPNTPERCVGAATSGELAFGWQTVSVTSPIGNKSVSQGTEGVLSFIKSRIYASAEPDLTSAGWYTFYRGVFFQRCAKGQSWEGGTVTKPPATDVRDLMLTIVNNNGTYAEKWFRINAGLVDGTSYKAFTARIGGYAGFENVDRTCKEVADEINKLYKPYILAVKSDPSAATPTSNPSGDGTNTVACTVDTIGWIICPVINFLAGVADSAFKFLSDSFLRTDPKILDTNNPTYAAWSIMRNIANGAFVLAFLIIIFSQLSGTGISNYGVKKMLPRLVIAAILVNTSYYICQIGVDLSNILGYSIRDMFSAIQSTALGSYTGKGADPWATGSGFTGVAGGILGFTGVVAVLYALLSTLIPVLLAAVVALIMILFILVARQAFIILLIVISPLAFVAFLLPNTEQWFKKWQKGLMTMLLLFPIIAVVYGASSLASGILSFTFDGGFDDKANNWFGQLIAAAVLILPLFIVPGLLKKSLDAMGNIGTTLNGIGAKLGGSLGKAGGKGFENSRLGQLQNYRKAERAKNRSLTLAGEYKGKNPLRKGISSINRGINSKTGRFGNRLAASGVALASEQDSKDIKSSEMLLQSEITSGRTTAHQALSRALTKGDKVQAKAAQNILFTQGASGMKNFYDTVSSAEKNGTANKSAVEALRENINTNHGQMVKTKAADVSKWAAGVHTTLEGATSDRKTWEGMSLADIIGQTGDSLNRAAATGGIAPEQVNDIFADPRLSNSLDAKQRDALSYSTYQVNIEAAPGGSEQPTTTTAAEGASFAVNSSGTAESTSLRTRAEANATAAATGAVGTTPIQVDSNGEASPVKSAGSNGSSTDDQGRQTPDGADEGYHDYFSK